MLRDGLLENQARTVPRGAQYHSRLAGRISERMAQLQLQLLPTSHWHATRLMSWTPHLRQFKVSTLNRMVSVTLA